jgi:hypothetical protein
MQRSGPGSLASNAAASTSLVVRAGIGRPLAGPVPSRGGSVASGAPLFPAGPTAGAPTVPPRRSAGVPVAIAAPGVPGSRASGRQSEPVPARRALAGEHPVLARREREWRPALTARSRACTPVRPGRSRVAAPTLLARPGSGRAIGPLGYERGGRVARLARNFERPIVAGEDRERTTALGTLRPLDRRRGGRRRRGAGALARGAERHRPLDQRRDPVAVSAGAGQHARLLYGVGDLRAAFGAGAHVVLSP